jgi:hypothetical protein
MKVGEFILLYYLAHPPWIAADLRIPIEGHYLGVDRNLVELIALCVLALLPVRHLPGLDNLKLIAEGHKNKEIANYLCISPKTVEKHRSNLMEKLDLHNVQALTAFAMEKGLISRE